MGKEKMEGFFKFLVGDKEAQAKVKSFGGDMDALAAYAREQGYDFSAEELREQQDKARRLIKDRVQKLQQPDASLSPGAQEFGKLVKLGETDEEVGKRLAEFTLGSADELIAYGKEKGFNFDRQDMKGFAESIMQPSDGLSEEELELAAGGCVGLAVAVYMVAAFMGVAAAGVVVAEVVNAVVEVSIKMPRS